MGKSRYRQDILFILILLAALIFSAWKANKGFADIDEAFYLTLPRRFLQGDSLLVDEWNTGLFSGLLLLPFMAVYNALFDSTDGIVLVFRWIFIAVQLLLSLYVYLCIRDRKGALWAVVPFMFYAPFNIMALSYNSMGIGFLTASLAGLCCSRQSRPRLIASGMFFAAAVLCNPYLAFVYLIYAVYTAVALILKKSRLYSKGLHYELKTFLLFTVGCIVLALPTVALILREPLEKIMAALPFVLFDPEHPPVSFFGKLLIYIECVFYSNPYSMRAMCLVLIAALLLPLDLRFFSGKHRDLIFLFSLAGVFLYIVGIMIGRRYVNCIMFPINIAGLFAYISSERKERRLFWLFWVPAMLYSFYTNVASNQAFYAISSSSAPATVPSILFIILRMKEASFPGLVSRVLRYSSGLCIAVTIVLLLGMRAYYCYWDMPVTQLDTKLERGCNAGLWTTSRRAEEYIQLIEETEPVRAQQGKVLYYTADYYLYLMDEKEIAAYSPWLSIISDTHSELWRLEKYYELQPEKLPDCIYLAKDAYVSPSMLMEAFGIEADVLESPNGYILTVK